MTPLQYGSIAAVYLAFALAEIATGRFFRRDVSTKKDVILEVGSTILLPALVAPTVLFAGASIARALFPAAEGALGAMPGAVMFAILLVADDLTQYAYHRASHTFPALFRLHRAHHSAAYIGVRIVYRNNLIYYALMPGIWLSGVLIFLGFGDVFVIYVVLKMAVVIGAHSSVPWDAPLYRHRLTRPFMWIVERIVSTPATHAAHHGLHQDDGVTHYKGNYGNFLFLWDVLFGTAKITRKRPEHYGIEDAEPATWQQELLWPGDGLREFSIREPVSQSDTVHER